MTSRDVVNVVQRRLKPLKIKVGHAGTLDPLAEGVLVLGVGPAVRLVPYVQQLPKHYRAKFLLGQSSVSGDLEGEPQQHPDLPVPTLEQLRHAACNLVGKITQTPPAHSAIWIDGKRAYQRIREGEHFEMPTRTVEVYSLDILSYSFPELELDIVCGSGTYIRTLGLDLGIAVGSTAVMAHLRRKGIGKFTDDRAVTKNQLAEDDLQSLLLPAAIGVEHMPQISIDTEQSTRLGHGLSIEGTAVSTEANANTDIATAMLGTQLRAIVHRRADAWYPKRVFPIPDSFA